MALRTVRAFLHNETTFPLTLTRAALDEGAWGDNGRQRPPATISAGATAMMRSESSGFPPGGTEAHVNYRIGSDSTENVALHWDNPVLGHNSYNQSTDPDHFVFRVGGPGNDAVVQFFLRPAGPRSTGFTPDRDGFKFANHWPETPYSLPPLRGSVLDLKYGNAANGLCGGMVFAARDYFEEGHSIPSTTTAPFGEQDPLFLFLVDRQFATFSVDTVSLMIKLMNPLYPDTDENVLAALGLAGGRSSVMANEEWPLIRADIDVGRPSPMVLITVKSTLPWDLGKCHQVLAYAYEVHGDDILLRVYDPNQPRNNDVHLRFNIRTVAERIVVQHNVAVHEDNGHNLRPIYCFARMNYTHRTPTVATPPRPPRPAVEVPRQVSLEVLGVETLSSSVVEHGRKKYEVFLCGEQEFDFTRVKQKQRATIAVHAISYVDPQVSWMLNDAAVPAGTDQIVRPHPSELGHAFSEQDAIGAHADPPVTVRTTTHGMLLRVDNVAEDGQYSLTARAVITERDGSEAVVNRLRLPRHQGDRPRACRGLGPLLPRLDRLAPGGEPDRRGHRRRRLRPARPAAGSDLGSRPAAARERLAGRSHRRRPGPVPGSRTAGRPRRRRDHHDHRSRARHRHEDGDRTDNDRYWRRRDSAGQPPGRWHHRDQREWPRPRRGQPGRARGPRRHPSKSGDHAERGEVIVVKLSVQETFPYFPDTVTFIRLP
jgi:hypothetical protein